MAHFQELKSNIDSSVNFVFENGQEARYVQRPDTDYFICYLSTHNGCNKACRFCFLTQLGHTDFYPATINEILEQAKVVLTHARIIAPATLRVSFSFMARGEPLASNSAIYSAELFQKLESLALDFNLKHNIKVSTIFPKGFSVWANPYYFAYHNVRLYWSLYSLDMSWRKRWIPNGEDPILTRQWVSTWQGVSHRPIIIHGAWIERENDDQAQAIDEFLTGIPYRTNIVRYNPFSKHQGEESSKLETIVITMKNSKVIPRVGKDVMASCGMFV